ncbi:MAG: D-lyxose/D-mannose family sugar isomerase [Halanaerobiales bacterium]
MKRSEVNSILKKGVEFLEEMNFHLPPFAYWTPDEWQEKGQEYDEIRENMLGWDITDFGSGFFNKVGLMLFTLRNGNINNPIYQKNYSEKIMIIEEDQLTPYHYHLSKMEDIINRGGGVLKVRVYNSDEKNKLVADTEVRISQDGRNFKVPAGSIVTLEPGESITLFPGTYHKFWAKKNKGKVLAGEVSMVNDDMTDNYFLEERGRFPKIVEDELPLYLLVTDYYKF